MNWEDSVHESTNTEALNTKKRLCGHHAANLDITATLHSLADVPLAMHESFTASQLYKQSLGMKRKVYGPDARNADIPSTLNNLATAKLDP
eukprot:4795841-Lingulodinium_polyedra.AAC.1